MSETTPSESESYQLAAGHRELLDQILDKWSLQVLERLCHRPSRFNELRRELPSVTGKSLTATLRRLERNGIVERVVLDARPVAVEYRITALGKTLREPVDVLFGWSMAHMPAVDRARRSFDRQSMS